MDKIDSESERLDIFPNIASSKSCWGIIRTPIARLEVKNIPTKVSIGNRVLYFKNQMPTMAINKKAKAPRKGSKCHMIPSASPGKATCDNASPTNAILFKITKLPNKLAEIETNTAVIKNCNNWVFMPN